MWLSFAAAVMLAALSVFLPGYLVARSLHASRAFSLCAAPLTSFGLFGILAIVYGMRGITCNWLTLVAAPAGIFLALCLLVCVLRGFEGTIFLSEELRKPLAENGLLSRMNGAGLGLLLALLTGIVLSGVVFLTALGTPEAFAPTYDNAWHLYRIHSFAKTGVHSSFTGALYPSVYHSICALVQATVGVSSPVAENAINYVLPALIFPVSSVLLLAAIYPDSSRRVWLGCLLCLSFAFFPWRIMLFGPLYPNVAAFSVMPAEAAFFILLCSPGKCVSERLRYLVLFLLGGLALALTQPNAIFSTAVFLIPFCMHAIWTGLREKLKDSPARSWLPIVAELSFVALVVGIWAYLYLAPFMQDVVHYPQPAPYDLGQGIRWLLSLCFVIRRRQFLLGVLVVIGELSLLIKSNKRWLAVSYALLGLLFVVGYGINSELRYILTGFWYADYYRLAAACCVFCVPVVAYGADTIFMAFNKVASLLSSKLRSASGEPKESRVANILALVVVLVLMAFNYYPFEFLPYEYRSYGFDAVNYELRDCYSPNSWGYLGDEEKAFLLEAKKLVPEGEVMLNQPYDGSVFAGSALDVDVVYNTFGSYDDPNYVTVRHTVHEVASNPDTKAALEAMGVHYLLQLDQGEGEFGMNQQGSYYGHGNNPEDWVGINSVRDDTPGFTLLLSEGDMRLYRIEY